MTLDQFMPFMLVELPGCPDPLIRQALLRAAEEFCRRTSAWNEIQEPIQLVAGVRDYDLDVPPGARVCAVLSVHVGSQALAPANAATLQRRVPGWMTAEATEPAFYNLVPDRDLLSVYPMPSEYASASMTVRAAYAPRFDAGSLPDFLGQRYLDAITGGAKAILMLMPTKLWSNPALAAYGRKQFDDALVDAMAEELHGRTVGSVGLQPRGFGVWA